MKIYRIVSLYNMQIKNYKNIMKLNIICVDVENKSLCIKF